MSQGACWTTGLELVETVSMVTWLHVLVEFRRKHRLCQLHEQMQALQCRETSVMH